MVSIQSSVPVAIPQSNQTLSDNVLRIGLYYVGWLALYFVSGWLSKLLIPQVRTLKPKEQMFWGLSIVRAICGFTAFWAAYLTFVDTRLSINRALATTDESWTFISVLTGFFIFEELTLIYFDVRYGTFSKELHFHHIFSFNGFFLAAYFNNSHGYAAQLFLLEGSTPFSCLCWCLLKLKMEKSKAWKINQWILIYIFHARTFYELWCWYTFYQDWDNMKQNANWLYTANMFIGLAMVTLWLTPYWTYKKTKQYFFPVDWNAEAKGKKKDEIDKTS